jgi:alpha/beta superfamily hydrolase
MKHKHLIILLVLLSMILTNCGPLSTAVPTSAPPTNTPELTNTPPPLPPTETPTPDKTAPKRIEFKSADGTNLVGYYYPAIVKNAPVVVLMHWTGGTQQDWGEPWQGVGVTKWLQNADDSKSKSFNGEYPPLPKGISFAVFTFDFRSFGESEGKEDPQGWLQDAQAAMLTAQTLPGVNSKRLSAIGASIGADAAVDACAEGCLGALSLSPGNFLGVPYQDAATLLDKSKKTAWCVAGEYDSPSPEACESASGTLYKKIIYSSGDHGMMFFFHKGLNPSIKQVLLDFITKIYLTAD